MPIKDPVDNSEKRNKHNKDPALTLVTLPNEIKEEIFRNLAPNDLLNLMQTCSAFNSYVEDNKNLMNKFTVRATQLLSSGVSSHRKYPRIFVDCNLSEEVIDDITKSFINIKQCVKVIIFDKRIDVAADFYFSGAEWDMEDSWRVYRVYSARDFILKCPNYMTINVIDGDKVEEKHKKQTKVKTFNAFRPSTLLPVFPNLVEMNLYEGYHYIGGVHPEPNLKFEKKLKNLNIFKFIKSRFNYAGRYSSDFLYASFPDNVTPAYQITIHDCIIDMEILIDYSSLKNVKFVNCRTDRDPFDFLDLRYSIDEVHIEDSEKLLWIQEVKEELKVYHLKLVNMKYPRSYIRSLENVQEDVQKLTMTNVKFY